MVGCTKAAVVYGSFLSSLHEECSSHHRWSLFLALMVVWGVSSYSLPDNLGYYVLVNEWVWLVDLHRVVAAWLWSFESKMAEWWYIDEIHRLKVSCWMVNWLWRVEGSLRLKPKTLNHLVISDNHHLFWKHHCILTTTFSHPTRWLTSGAVFSSQNWLVRVNLSTVSPLTTLCAGAVNLQLLV